MDFRFQEFHKAHGLGDWGRLKNNYLSFYFWDQTRNETIEDHLGCEAQDSIA